MQSRPGLPALQHQRYHDRCFQWDPCAETIRESIGRVFDGSFGRRLLGLVGQGQSILRHVPEDHQEPPQPPRHFPA
jgi:hypothetical protein